MNGMTDGASSLFYDLLSSVNGLGEEGASVIARALESNHTLTTLILWGTDSLYKWSTTPKNGIDGVLIL
jgi:hypothetical protein